jgi:hypothetical protein
VSFTGAANNTNDTYTATATANSTGDIFSIVENAGTQTEPCTAGSGGGSPGGCPTSNLW